MAASFGATDSNVRRVESPSALVVDDLIGSKEGQGIGVALEVFHLAEDITQIIGRV
jgi:hypothetical protein